MRVVSLVPSLTETLLEAGAEVVGRTRYCVHPEQARALPVVGGTKDLDFTKLAALRPELLVLDREENLPWMKEQAPCAVNVFHATSIKGMAGEMRALAEQWAPGPVREALTGMTARWEAVAAAPARAWDWRTIPEEKRRAGPGELGRAASGKPSSGAQVRNWENCLYLIWRDPWMTVSQNTFIGSVLAKLGAPAVRFDELYPKIDLADFDPEKTLLLMSSEPFPFEKKWDELASLPHTRVLIDGEPYSWFGIRALRFLEGRLGIQGP